MAAPRKINDAGRKRILAVAIARRMLPTDQQLANELGCTVRGVQTAMTRLLLLIDEVRTVSRGTISGSIAGHSPLCATVSRDESPIDLQAVGIRGGSGSCAQDR